MKIFLPETPWKQISDADRKVIIDYNRKIPTKKPTSAPSTPYQKVRLHHHKSSGPTEEAPAANTTPTADPPADSLLAMVHQTLHDEQTASSDIDKFLVIN